MPLGWATSHCEQTGQLGSGWAFRDKHGLHSKRNAGIDGRAKQHTHNITMSAPKRLAVISARWYTAPGTLAEYSEHGYEHGYVQGAQSGG